MPIYPRRASATKLVAGSCKSVIRYDKQLRKKLLPINSPERKRTFQLGRYRGVTPTERHISYIMLSDMVSAVPYYNIVYRA